MHNLLFPRRLFTLTFAPAPSFRRLDKSPMDKASFPASYRISDKVATITYSRPQLKGRAFADIVSFGKIWRTGANEATELLVFKPIAIDGTEIPTGTYSIFTIFETGKMTFIVNKASNLWGSYAYDKAQDLLRFEVLTTTEAETLEAVSVVLSGDGTPTLHLGGENATAKVPCSV